MTAHSLNSIGVVLFPGAEELDFVGPWEMLTMWKAYADGPSVIETVALETKPLRCAKGMTVVPDRQFGTTEYECVLVPGGFAVFDMAKQPAFMDALAAACHAARYVLSVCTGSFLLHHIGVLNGRRATTHWKAMDQFRDLSGHIVTDERYTSDGRIWTAGGVSAGIDMSLAFIASVAGDEAARTVQANAEYYPDPDIAGATVPKGLGPGYLKKRG